MDELHLLGDSDGEDAQPPEGFVLSGGQGELTLEHIARASVCMALKWAPKFNPRNLG